jgi:hypothetical protein
MTRPEPLISIETLVTQRVKFPGEAGK